MCATVSHLEDHYYIITNLPIRSPPPWQYPLAQGRTRRGFVGDVACGRTLLARLTTHNKTAQDNCQRKLKKWNKSFFAHKCYELHQARSRATLGWSPGIPWLCSDRIWKDTYVKKLMQEWANVSERSIAFTHREINSCSMSSTRRTSVEVSK